MYSILVVDNNRKIQSKETQNLRCIQGENIEVALKEKEYDLIYLTNELINDKVMKIILADYMILPKILKKLGLNSQICQTFINIQILNKLIMDNIQIVDFNDYYEKITIANVVKEKIINPRKLKLIYAEMCSNNEEKSKTRKAADSVIERSYIGGNFFRKYKYKLKRRKIQEIFFDKIIVNISNDISNMEELDEGISKEFSEKNNAK